MFLYLLFFYLCMPLYAADARSILHKACNSSDSSHAISLFSTLFDHKMLGPEARISAAARSHTRGEKRKILGPLLTTSHLDFDPGSKARYFQIKACEMLLHADKEDPDAYLVSAFNLLAIVANQDIDEQTETAIFPEYCRHALQIISNWMLIHHTVESPYVVSYDKEEQKKFLEKILLSGDTHGVPSAKLIHILAPENKSTVRPMFNAFYKAYPYGSIEALCMATKHGNIAAGELACYLAGMPNYAHQRSRLLATAADANMPKAHLELACKKKTLDNLFQLAFNADFPLHVLAQKRLSEKILKHARNNFQIINSCVYTTEQDRLNMIYGTFDLFEKIIPATDKTAAVHQTFFKKYMCAVRQSASTNLPLKQEIYTHAHSFLKERLIFHPAAEHAFIELTNMIHGHELKQVA